MQRAIGEVSRAIPFYNRGRFPADMFDQRQREARLADARLPGDVHDLPVSVPRHSPPGKERAELLLAADERIETRDGASVETALRQAFSKQAIDRHRLGKAFQDDIAPLLVFEHPPA